MTGTIFDIQRFCLHDGPGIRTTVFFKGCPLRCLWCHNPESQSGVPQLMFYSAKCIGCGKCRQICEKAFTDECKNCTDVKCADVCSAGARIKSGKTIEASEVISTVLRDKEFYSTSGGGVTLSGGEPLAQPDFAAEILSGCREKGIHTAIETAGYVPMKNLETVVDFTDLFLFDIKGIDPENHRKNTGRDNELILRNAEYLKEKGKDILFRMPVIPGYNDSEVSAVAEFTKGHTLELMNYHTIGNGKYKALGRETDIIPAVPFTAEEIAETAKKNKALYSAAGV